MRRLTRRLFDRVRRDERGAVSVLVAISMVALLGFVAIALDIGALYAERAELQAGADAAALAVAQDCAASGACTTTGPTASWLAPAATTARSLANANARDGATNVASLTSPAAYSVQVTTGTKDGRTGAGALAFTFAPLLGIDSARPTATATAGWGSPKAGPAVIGLAFAPCEFALAGPIQVVATHGGGSCSSTSPSGQNLPGGFGWLKATPAGSCSAYVDIAVNAIVSSDTGNSIPAGCANVLEANKGRTVLLPVYSDVGGAGSGGWYKIRGWAAFQLLGWNFPGSSWNSNVSSNGGAKCTGSCDGIIGRFVRFVSLDDRFTRGGPDLGASLVSLTQ